MRESFSSCLCAPRKESTTSKKRQQDRDGLHKRRGIWHFKIKVSGHWREMSTHTTKYQEARKYRDKTLRNQEEGRLPTDKAKWKFAQAAEHWLDQKNKIAPSTWRIEKHRVQRLKDRFADIRLCQVTSYDISSGIFSAACSWRILNHFEIQGMSGL